MRNRDIEASQQIKQDLSAETIVGASLKIQGDLKSEGNIRIDGEVQGSVTTSGNVFIGKEALVEATIQAGSAEISGRVTGDISVQKKLELQPTARLKGNITAAELVILQGAQFNGSSSMSNDNAELKTAQGAAKLKATRPEVLVST